MLNRNRRGFLADVGRGMLIGSVGSCVASDLGLSSAVARDDGTRVTFGAIEPLVSLMQETEPDKLLPLLVEKLQRGTTLKLLVSAGALANVRAFAGQDYTGYHTFMALLPAMQMAAQLPREQQPLPVLKVLYRNTSRIQHEGASHKDALHAVNAASIGTGESRGEELRAAVRALDWQGTESRFATLAKKPAGEAFNHLQFAVQDEVDVHRVVLSWRALAMLDVTGSEHAHTLLRQSVRYCLSAEQQMHDQNRARSPIRELLPRLMDEHKLLSKPTGTRTGDDVWAEQLASTIYSGTREQAAVAVAIALSEGFDPEQVGEALSIAANMLVLHDPGRLEQHSSKEKPAGCVHGDSIGVHASDAANAWRNISRVGNERNRVSSLIVGAFHTGGQVRWSGEGSFPYVAELESLRATDAKTLLGQADEAIGANDQARASAVVHRYGELKLPVRPVLDLLLGYAVSEDGALHAEKYYQTVTEEYGTIRAGFRWREIVALARVTASEHGYPAPGIQQSRDLLRLS
jgi:hypothetical protein